MWSELREAKKVSGDIEKELELLMRKHSSLYKTEIAKHQELLITEVDETMSNVQQMMDDLMKNLAEHRNVVNAKSKFLRRHNSRVLKRQH